MDNFNYNTAKLRKQIILLFLIFAFLPQYVQSQIYPVQVVTEIVPPYSVYLSDYTTPGTGKFAVNLLLTDVTRYSYPVKLRLVIEGEGISVTTSTSYMPTQIILDGGSPLRLTGDELADYFNPNNLDFKGYSKQKYIQTGSLPEGIYRIGFQVLDYNKSIPVSLTGSATAWLVLNDPPMFNTPEKDIKLTATEPQNIMFQWMPRHLGSPNSAFNAEYVLQIYEIWPEGRNPNEVVAATQPLIEKTTISTSYIYSNTTEAALIPGRQYAYRVQARDIEGRDLFRNKGYSEVQKFTYGDPCNPPTQIAAQSNNAGMITINWEASEYNTAYLLQYREAGNNNGMWYPKTSYINSATIDKLKPQTKYEYKIQGQCGTVNSDYSEVMSVTTQAKKPTEVVCGTSDAATPLKSTLPLTSLLPGDIITSGQFEVQVTKATGGNGKWTGEGFMHVPFMGVKVRMTFTDININDKFQVTKGRIVSIYNPDSKFVAQVGENKQNTTNTLIQTQTGNQDKDTSANVVAVTSPIDTTVKAKVENTVVVSQNGDTATIHTNADGTKVLISATGDSTKYTGEAPLINANGSTIADNNGISSGSNTSSSSVSETVSFAVQQDILKIGYGQNIPVVFSIFHDLKDTDNANVVFKVNNTSFSKTQSLSSLEDKDPKTDLPAQTFGEKFYHMSWIPKLEMENFPQPGKYDLTFDLQRNDKQLAQKVLQIEVLPKYELTGLTATDAKKSKRVAKAGETLYLVKEGLFRGTRSVNYKVTNKGGENAFWPADISWKTKLSDNKETTYDSHNSSISIATNDFPYVVSNKNKNITTVTAFDGQEKSVNIELLHQNLKKQEFTSLEELLGLLPAKLAIFKILQSKMGSIVKDPSFAFNLQVKRTLTTQNVEDVDTRFYLNKKTDAYTLKINFNNSEPDIKKNFKDEKGYKVFFIPGLSFDWYVIKVGAYIKPSFYLTLSYNEDFNKYNYEKDYKEVKDYFKVTGNANLEFGVSVKTGEATRGEVFIEVKAYGKAGIVIEYNYTENKIKAYIEPLVAGFSAKAEITSVGWEMVNYQFETQILDRVWLIE